MSAVEHARRGEAVRAAIAREAASGSHADAYLLTSPSRAVLRELALSCAAELLGARGDVRQHADCVVLDPEELGVDGLRVEHVARRREGVPCLETALRYRPAGGGRRVAVLFEADRMNPDAQGALLKTAEEPPEGTVLILTATALADLLPALRSRCRLWRVPPEDPATLAARARAEGVDEEAWPVLCAACGGGERALALDAAERALLLETWERFRAWRAGAGTAAAWLQPEEGSVAEQRNAAVLRLGAARNWLLSEGEGHDDPRRLRWAALLDEAIADLSGQVTPSLVLAGLRQQAS